MSQADPGISSGPVAFMVGASYNVVASTLLLCAEHLDGLRDSNHCLYLYYISFFTLSL